MIKFLSTMTAIGFLIGLAALPAFAESPASKSAQLSTTDRADINDAEDIGAALGGRDIASKPNPEPGPRTVSATTNDCRTDGSCGGDAERARRILAVILASMGTRETSPTDRLGLPRKAQ